MLFIMSLRGFKETNHCIFAFFLLLASRPIVEETVYALCKVFSPTLLCACSWTQRGLEKYWPQAVKLPQPCLYLQTAVTLFLSHMDYKPLQPHEHVRVCVSTEIWASTEHYLIKDNSLCYYTVEKGSVVYFAVDMVDAFQQFDVFPGPSLNKCLLCWKWRHSSPWVSCPVIAYLHCCCC